MGGILERTKYYNATNFRCETKNRKGLTAICGKMTWFCGCIYFRIFNNSAFLEMELLLYDEADRNFWLEQRLKLNAYLTKALRWLASYQ